MFRKFIVIQMVLSFAATLIACQAALARERDVSDNGKYSFQVETNGRVAPVYYHRGAAYVEGRHYDQYAIRVFNHSGRRVEAVVTVDGRDVITGDRGDYRKHRGYILEPYGSVLIEGFRRSWNDVAAFYFTTNSDSYASRRGDPINLGVIGVAVFEEKQRRRPRPKPIRPLPPVRPEPYYSEYSNDRVGTSKGKRSSGESADAYGAASERRGEAAPASRRRPSQNMGTGYGNDTYSPAVETVFKRRNSRRPSSLLKLYYDDYQGLVDKGVRVAPPHRPPYYPPQPFPETPRRFAPAPR